MKEEPRKSADPKEKEREKKRGEKKETATTCKAFTALLHIIFRQYQSRAAHLLIYHLERNLMILSLGRRDLFMSSESCPTRNVILF